MARQFLTVAEELLVHAECVAEYFEEHGYSVKVEQGDIEYPYTPTLHCKRSRTTVLVEIYSSIRYDHIDDWTRYARSCNRDTRIALALPRDVPRTPDDDSKLRDLGVGLYLSDGEKTEEVIAPLDMAVNVQLPDLKTFRPKMRKVIGPVYEQFVHSHWREGFEEACQAVEVLARQYLKEAKGTGRIVFVTETGKQRNLTDKQIDKLPLGALAEAFGQIQTQNYSDSTIGKVLRRINKDRVGVAHHKAKPATESRLRKNVGQHMWSVFGVLKLLLGIKP
jgi:hypothetical protein